MDVCTRCFQRIIDNIPLEVEQVTRSIFWISDEI